MNLLELKHFVDKAIEDARRFGEDPEKILVSIQIDDTPSEALWSDDTDGTRRTVNFWVKLNLFMIIIHKLQDAFFFYT